MRSAGLCILCVIRYHKKRVQDKMRKPLLIVQLCSTAGSNPNPMVPVLQSVTARRKIVCRKLSKENVYGRIGVHWSGCTVDTSTTKFAIIMHIKPEKSRSPKLFDVKSKCFAVTVFFSTWHWRRN